MIIQAMSRFACQHRYVAQIDAAAATEAGNANLVMLVCERCGHRAEQLPLQRESSFGRVLAFPVATPKYVQSTRDRYTDPPPLLTLPISRPRRRTTESEFLAPTGC